MLRQILFFCGFTWATSALAWDADGHRASGFIAQKLLTPAAGREVRKLLGDMTLASATTWMDRERKRLGDPFAKWHYDNRPICDDKAELSTYCADGNCLSAQLPLQLAIVADKKAADAERRQALLFVAHMVGDLHQPFHSGDHNDRGGNQLFVLLPRGDRKTIENLHRYWDDVATELAMKGERSEAFAKRLLMHYSDQKAQWTAGDAQQWQVESYQLAQEVGYGSLPDFSCTQTRDHDAFILSEAYNKKAGEIAEQQLAKAGFRLAALLNQALGNP